MIIANGLYLTGTLSCSLYHGALLSTTSYPAFTDHHINPVQTLIRTLSPREPEHIDWPTQDCTQQSTKHEARPFPTRRLAYGDGACTSTAV